MRMRGNGDLDYVINEAISMWLENHGPQALVDEHFDMWQRTPSPIPQRGLEIVVSVKELAHKIKVMADTIEATAGVGDGS